MTKKHFIAIAKILNSVYRDSISDDEKLTTLAIAYHLCNMFKKDNSDFDKQKFLDAILK